MRILSMTATFGKLEHATLTLEPGLNILEAPNEWGKSTWCAFILAMLYGIDSRAHSATKAGLADKTRFDPWSGQLMSGRMELNWNGRDITIERSSTKQGPLRQFKAYETRTGAPLDLTAENCGQMLLGVEKEVFQRAGFIRLAHMPVTQNEALRRRLNALVTTGDESGAADRLSQRFNKLKNEIRANRSHGLLPQAQAQKQSILEKLRQLEALRSEASRLQQEQSRLEAALQDAQGQSEARQAQLRQALAALEAESAALQKPAVPQAFAGLSVKDGCQQAQTDHKVYIQACKERRLLPCLLALLPAVGAVPCLWIPQWWGKALALGLVLAAVIAFTICRATAKRAAATAEALSRKYGGMEPAQWEPHIRKLLTQQEEYVQAITRLDAARSKHLADLSKLLHPLEDSRAQALAQYRQVHLLMGRCQGQMDTLGSEEGLRKELSAVEERIRALEDTLAAVELSQQTLAEATTQLQRRFAPRITRRANALFSQMTGGRYDRLTLSEDLSLQAAARDEDILRGSLWRSDGTVDQLYLSLRLAVSAELTPGAPLILDDALVRFDDDRLRQAMTVLQEEAQSRQVILFTCQSREKKSLSPLGGAP